MRDSFPLCMHFVNDGFDMMDCAAYPEFGILQYYQFNSYFKLGAIITTSQLQIGDYA